MKERPILFSGDMVRAILEGRKTQTRRVIKGRPENKTRVGKRGAQAHIASPEAINHCPYGQPGDRLWVREKWTPFYLDGAGSYREMRYHTEANAISYAATPGICIAYPRNYVLKFEQKIPEWLKINKWRPSIHMPRWASRITLEITNVRVERLQDILHADAVAEGVTGFGCRWMDYRDNTQTLLNAVASYCTLWLSINGAESWAANPWVWVVEFKRVDK